MHTRTRSIYNRSRSADLCVCASHLVSFQNVHIHTKEEEEEEKKTRGCQRETRQKTLSNALLKMTLIYLATLTD